MGRDVSCGERALPAAYPQVGSHVDPTVAERYVITEDGARRLESTGPDGEALEPSPGLQDQTGRVDALDPLAEVDPHAASGQRPPCVHADSPPKRTEQPGPLLDESDRRIRMPQGDLPGQLHTGRTPADDNDLRC